MKRLFRWQMGTWLVRANPKPALYWLADCLSDKVKPIPQDAAAGSAASGLPYKNAQRILQGAPGVSDGPDASKSQYMKAVPGLEKPFDFIYLTPRAELTAEIEKHQEKKKTGNIGKR